MEPFRLNKIRHHETLMPLIWYHFGTFDRQNRLFYLTKSSRAYLFKHFKMLSKDANEDLFESFRQKLTVKSFEHLVKTTVYLYKISVICRINDLIYYGGRDCKVVAYNVKTKEESEFNV